MSEKATLLTSIPPVAKSGNSEKASLLSATDASSTSANTGKLLSPTSSSSGQLMSPVSKGDAVVPAGQVDGGTTEDSVASEGVAVVESGKTITPFQGAIYASFVLTFCLAGFAAVVLFRKASKIVEARFVTGAKALGAGFGLIALHGFFVTYLFANYLNGEGASVPLVVSMALWVFVGPVIAIVLNYLLTPGSAPKVGVIAFDACAYVIIFACSVISLISAVKENAALVFSLLGGFLFIVPVARSLTKFRMAKARHPELLETSDQVLVYALLVLPALLPLLAIAHVFRMNSELTLFVINFITFDFILIAGFAMIASVDALASKTPAVQPSGTAAAGQQRSAGIDAPKSAVVDFNGGRQSQAKKLPPRKPTMDPAMPAAPRKPGTATSPMPVVEASNAPSTIKAPLKPKKRF